MMILDAYCCQGGAAAGLKRTFPNARIVGVDIEPQSRYPFEFYQANALWFIDTYGKQFDFIWASPPCQAYSKGVPNYAKGRHPDLVEPTRRALKEVDKPYIIENVPGAPLEPTVWLCGTMFDLKVYRHRLFECSFAVPQPDHASHTEHVGYGKNSFVTAVGGANGSRNLMHWSNAMRIDWMDRHGLTQAVPPAYAEYLAQHIPVQVKETRTT